MTTAALWVLAFAASCVVLLFLGGLCSAFLENRKERRETGTVTRPGWQRQPKRYERAGLTSEGRGRDYVNRLVVWPLLFLGLAGAADRFMARRAAGRHRLERAS